MPSKPQHTIATYCRLHRPDSSQAYFIKFTQKPTRSPLPSAVPLPLHTDRDVPATPISPMSPPIEESSAEESDSITIVNFIPMFPQISRKSDLVRSIQQQQRHAMQYIPSTTTQTTSIFFQSEIGDVSHDALEHHLLEHKRFIARRQSKARGHIGRVSRARDIRTIRKLMLMHNLVMKEAVHFVNRRNHLRKVTETARLYGTTRVKKAHARALEIYETRQFNRTDAFYLRHLTARRHRQQVMFAQQGKIIHARQKRMLVQAQHRTIDAVRQNDIVTRLEERDEKLLFRQITQRFLKITKAQRMARGLPVRGRTIEGMMELGCALGAWATVSGQISLMEGEPVDYLTPTPTYPTLHDISPGAPGEIALSPPRAEHRVQKLFPEEALPPMSAAHKVKMGIDEQKHKKKRPISTVPTPIPRTTAVPYSPGYITPRVGGKSFGEVSSPETDYGEIEVETFSLFPKHYEERRRYRDAISARVGLSTPSFKRERTLPKEGFSGAQAAQSPTAMFKPRLDVGAGAGIGSMDTNGEVFLPPLPVMGEADRKLKPSIFNRSEKRKRQSQLCVGSVHESEEEEVSQISEIDALLGETGSSEIKTSSTPSNVEHGSENEILSDLELSPTSVAEPSPLYTDEYGYEAGKQREVGSQLRTSQVAEPFSPPEEEEEEEDHFATPMSSTPLLRKRERIHKDTKFSPSTRSKQELPSPSGVP